MRLQIGHGVPPVVAGLFAALFRPLTAGITITRV